MSLIGKPAPDFTAPAVVDGRMKDDFKLSSLKGQYVLLFFYPLDFTFVCPTELHAFQERLAEFRQRRCEVVGVSIDSKFSHYAWVNTPKAEGGIQGVTYPLVSDLTKKIARDYDVLVEEAGIALRGLFLVDRAGVVQHLLVNNLPLGRSVEEALRVLDALQFTEEHGEVCPANWSKGRKAMKPTEEGKRAFFAH